jgi:hypothetical protein
VNWRPIEDAPKDRIILVGYDDAAALKGRLQVDQRVYECRWNEPEGTWSSRNGFALHMAATHWTEMPKPPCK